MREKHKSHDFFHAQKKRLEDFISTFEEKHGEQMVFDRKKSRVFFLLRKFYFDHMLVEYSLGLPKEELSISWDKYFRSFKFSQPVKNYSVLVEAASLAVILDAPSVDVSTMIELAANEKMMDPLLSKLLMVSELQPEIQISSPDKVIAFLTGSSENGGDLNLFELYLKGWYDLNQGEYWHNQHLESGNTSFYGYWSIEAAAIFKKYFTREAPSIEYFPRDLVT